jgi:hypothetical protein
LLRRKKIAPTAGVFSNSRFHRHLLVHCDICLHFGQSHPYTAFKSGMASEK